MLTRIFVVVRLSKVFWDYPATTGPTSRCRRTTKKICFVRHLPHRWEPVLSEPRPGKSLVTQITPAVCADWWDAWNRQCWLVGCKGDVVVDASLPEALYYNWEIRIIVIFAASRSVRGKKKFFPTPPMFRWWGLRLMGPFHDFSPILVVWITVFYCFLNEFDPIFTDGHFAL